MIILLWIGSTTFWGYQAKDLKPDFEFEKLFPTNDPDIVFYEKHLAQFGYDNDFMLIILEADPLFNQTFLKNVEKVGKEIEKISGTISLVSPLDVVQTISSPIGTLSIPVLHIDEPERYQSDSIKIFSHPLYSSFFGKDGKSLVIQVTHDHFSKPETADQYQFEIEYRLDQYPFSNYRLVGKVSAQKEFIHFIQKDFAVFIGAALLISLFLLGLIFRSFRSAIVPYLIAISSLVWLLGLMAFSGNSITVLGSLIPPIILFVSTSDAIHFLNAYRKSNVLTQSDRINFAFSKVFMPTLLTSITTAIGFFSLLIIPTEPVQMFGLFSGIGVVIAFVMTFILAPILIYNWTPIHAKPFDYKWLVVMVLRKQKLIIALSFLVVILSLFGLSKLEVDALLLGDLPNDSEVKQDFEYAENQYSGYKPFEIAYWPKEPDKDIWSQNVMDEASKIQNYITEEYGVGRIWSPVSAMYYGNQSINGGIGHYYQYPDSVSYRRAKNALKPIIRADSSLQGTVGINQKYARIKGFIPEWGSKETIEHNNRLLIYLNKNIDPSVLGYQITGTTYLIDKSHESLSKNLIIGLFIAILLVSLILGLYFKSIKILLISLIPNLIPLLITAGFMGIAGISLKLTTSIIFAVSFGIAVDDTIHFISSYRKAKTRNRVYQMLQTFQSAGSAIIITSVIILAGFGIFLFSSFGATYFLGLFISLALASAMIIDLTLLPIILNFLNKNTKD